MLNKILRTPLEPAQTYSDDPLRMMRAIRFASVLHFEIEKILSKPLNKKQNASKLFRWNALWWNSTKLC